MFLISLLLGILLFLILFSVYLTVISLMDKRPFRAVMIGMVSIICSTMFIFIIMNMAILLASTITFTGTYA